MHMAVDHVLGFVFVHKVDKCGKPLMRNVLRVSEPLGGRVGQENVNASASEHPETERADAVSHFRLCILVDSRLVAVGAAEPENAKPLIAEDLVLDADAAFRGRFYIAVIMVSVNIQHRNLCKGREKGKVLRGQVAAGEDEVILI